MMKKFVAILLILSILCLTPIYCLAEEEDNRMLSIGVEDLVRE